MEVTGLAGEQGRNAGVDRSAAMPILAAIRRDLKDKRSFAGWGVLLNLHLTPETLELGRTLHEGGARVLFMPANRNPAPPEIERRAGAVGEVLSSSEAIAALRSEPVGTLVIEGNGRIFSRLQEGGNLPPVLAAVHGLSMHTSSGGRKVDATDPESLRVAVVAVYRDRLKTELETGLGSSQSTAAAVLSALRRPIAGRSALVVGFGGVGRGIARTLRALGARVRVAEIGPEARLTAHLEGFPQVELPEGLAGVDLCLTATGLAGVIGPAALALARDGLTLATVGDCPEEIDVSGCEPCGGGALSATFRTPGGAVVRLLAGGIQVNHVLARGNPCELIDLSFGLHVLCLRWLVEARPAPGLFLPPRNARDWVASLYVTAWG
jgi:adenosylhomocysteinase